VHKSIERLAYQLWLERDCPHGSPDADWYAAERVQTMGILEDVLATLQQILEVSKKSLQSSLRIEQLLSEQAPMPASIKVTYQHTLIVPEPHHTLQN